MLRLGFGVLLGVYAASPMAAEVVLAGREVPVPATYFGLHLHKVVQPSASHGRSAWPSIRFGSWRLTDGSKWAEINPARGSWRPTILDKSVELAQGQGVTILMPLVATPRWAALRHTEQASWGVGAASPPTESSDWRSFVRYVAERYRGKIEAYEIWNEPKYADLERVARDGRALGFFSGTSTEMVDLARVANEEIRRADPEALIVAPAPTGETNDRVRLFLAQGGGRYVDVMSFHIYPAVPETDIPRKVAMVREAMRKAGVGAKPLWNTESGFQIGEPGTGRFGGDAERVAGKVARSLLLGWAAGLDRYYWYGWDDGAFALASQFSSSVPNAAGTAYGAMREWMLGNVVKSCRGAKDVWRCHLFSQEGQNWAVMWTTGGEIAHQLPAAEARASVTRLDGKAISGHNGTVILSERPIRVGPF